MNETLHAVNVKKLLEDEGIKEAIKQYKAKGYVDTDMPNGYVNINNSLLDIEAKGAVKTTHFAGALKFMKSGEKVTRPSLKGNSIYLEDSQFYMIANSHKFDESHYIYKFTSDDLLAEDWFISDYDYK